MFLKKEEIHGSVYALALVNEKRKKNNTCTLGLTRLIHSKRAIFIDTITLFSFNSKFLTRVFFFKSSSAF